MCGVTLPREVVVVIAVVVVVDFVTLRRIGKNKAQAHHTTVSCAAILTHTW